MAGARTELHTPRLLLQAPEPAQATEVAAFYARNSAHFAPWSPPQPPDANDRERALQALVDGRQAFVTGSACRWWLVLPQAPDRIVGSVHLSQIARGPFQSATLGYALDADCQGRGLMHEALAAVLAEAFSPRLNLHRVQAAILPANTRSLAVARRLGMHDEGLARDYLYIAGAWRDHRIFALTNPGFNVPADWAVPGRPLCDTRSRG